MGRVRYEVFRRAQHIPKELLVFRPHILLFAFRVITWGQGMQGTGGSQRTPWRKDWLHGIQESNSGWWACRTSVLIEPSCQTTHRLLRLATGQRLFSPLPVLLWSLHKAGPDSAWLHRKAYPCRGITLPARGSVTYHWGQAGRRRQEVDSYTLR